MIASLYQRGSSVSPKTSGGILAIIPVGEPQGSPRFLIRRCIRRSASEVTGRASPGRRRPESADDSLQPINSKHRRDVPNPLLNLPFNSSSTLLFFLPKFRKPPGFANALGTASPSCPAHTFLRLPLTHVALGSRREMRIRRLQRLKLLKFTGPIQVFVSPPFR